MSYIYRIKIGSLRNFVILILWKVEDNRITVQLHRIWILYLSSTGSEQTGSFHSVLNEQAGQSHNDPFMQNQWDDSGRGLTFIGYQVTSEEFMSLASLIPHHTFIWGTLTFDVSFWRTALPVETFTRVRFNSVFFDGDLWLNRVWIVWMSS